MEEKVRGRLVIIGGAEDKSGRCKVLQKVIELSGGDRASVAVVTVATQKPKEHGAKYAKIFNGMGIAQVNTVHIEARADANNLDNIRIFKEASCIFFTGGDQLRITSLMGGTEVENILRRRYDECTSICGTSAGASVMSETMVHQEMMTILPKMYSEDGTRFGSIEGSNNRSTFCPKGDWKTTSCHCTKSYMLGIGIDEDTGIVVMPDAIFEVIGSNGVTILDGRNCSMTNVSELEPDQVLGITDVTMHVLPAGFQYDLASRKPVIRR